ncbi:MAG: hypothetical protein ABR505_00215 [Actinomycetota bacterium]
MEASFETLDVGVCQYEYPAPPPDEVAYLPGCFKAKGIVGGGADFTFSGSGRPKNISVITSFGYHDQGFGQQNLTGSMGSAHGFD